MTGPTYNDPFGLLRLKKNAELACGAFASLEPVPPAQRSRYAADADSAETALGLGYVQAVLAVLFGVVSTFSYDRPGTTGRVSMRSIGGSTVYNFSWAESDGRLLMGGFVHGGHPTYQVAVIALCHAIAAYRCTASPEYQEVVDAWYALVRAMDREYPRVSHEVPWDKRTIEAACRSEAIRPLIVTMCDVLRVALRYRLPGSATREVGVTEPQVLATGAAGTQLRLAGATLLDPNGMAISPSETAAPRPGSAVAPKVAAPRKAGAAPRPSRALRPLTPSPAPHSAATPAAPPAPSPTAATRDKATPSADPAPPPVGETGAVLLGPHVGRIKRALARGGPVMLIGPTATGKTTQAKDAAAQLGMGFELVVLDEGWDAQELFGGYTRAGKDWTFTPGPITRWAERVSAGETVMLIIDELARGHRSVVSAIMRVMNEYSARDLERMGLSTPGGEAGPFYLVDVTATKQRIPVPCRRARIVATANQGEGYTGMNLNDPAFRRRWTGGWLQLRGHEADVVRAILCDRLGLPHGSMLITKLQAVALHVAEYQRREESLISTLDLATLIAWGQAALSLHRDSANLRQAFTESASDIWIDRVVPLKGADLDPEIERVLQGYVTSNAPSTV